MILLWMKYLISIDLDWTIVVNKNSPFDKIINYLVNRKNNSEVILLINTCRRFSSYKNIINNIPFNYLSLECWNFLLNEKWKLNKKYFLPVRGLFFTFINKNFNKNVDKHLNKWRLSYLVSGKHINIIGKYEKVYKFSNRLNYFFSDVNKSNPIKFLQKWYNISNNNIYIFGDEEIDFYWCKKYNTLTFNSLNINAKYKLGNKTNEWILDILQYINDKIWW